MNMKFAFRMGARTLAYHLFRKRAPLNLMLSLTDRCNARCRYCSIPSRAKPEMSTEQIFSIIDQFASLGGSRIALWGGEPLIRKDVGDIVRYCKTKNVLTSMDTNGYLVPQKIDEIKDLDVLVISFDGEEEAHDLNREKGSYQKALKAIETACGKMNVWTITVLTKHNLNSIDPILEKAKKLGFYTTWQVLHHQALGSEKPEDMLANNDEYRKAIELLIKRKTEGEPIVNSLTYFNYIYNWPDFSKACFKDKHCGLSCYAGQLYCNVDVDGSVYPCSLLVDMVPAKNALEVGLKEAFDHAKDIPCQSCSGGCYIEYNYTYSLNPQIIMNWFRYISKKGLR